jgi:hypothetical protein
MTLLTVFFTEHGVDPAKMAAFGSDGASVMTGNVSGLAKKLTDNFNNFLICIHCVAHRLALASNDSMDCDPIFKRFETTLSDLFSFYSRSPKRTGGLEAICSQTDIVFHTLQHPSKTRWLSRSGSCSAALHALAPAIEHLQAESADKTSSAANLLERVGTFEWIFILHFMRDVLFALSLLSKLFQNDRFLFSEVSDYVDYTVSAMKIAYTGPDAPMGNKLQSFLQCARSGVGNGGFDAFGIHFDPTLDEVNNLVAVCQKFASSLVLNLESRFPHNALLSAFDIFNPSLLNADEFDELPPNYGDVQIGIIADHFCKRRGNMDHEPKVDRERLLAEWPIVAQFLHKYREKDMIECWKPVMRRGGAMFQEVCKVVSVVLLIPTNTACCERGFSAVNLIKTFLRNKMKTPLLKAIMMIRLNGPSPTDEAGMAALLRAAFITWNELRKRVPQRSSRNPRPGRAKHLASLRNVLDELATHAELPVPQVNAAEQMQADLDEVGNFDPPAGLVVEMEQPAITAVTLKGRLLGIKFTNGWHVGKVASHSMRTGLTWIIYQIQYAPANVEADDEAYRNRMQHSHALTDLRYGADGEWVVVNKVM